MKRRFLRVLGNVVAVGAIGMLLVAPFASTQALSTPSTALRAPKTYSFTPTHAKNYVTTGTLSFVDTSADASTDWYNVAWKYRQKITINKDFVGEELMDFPVVIRLNETVTDAARDDGHDFLITSSDGVTKLAHEREDRSTLWVKVPILSSDKHTVLYLYYGNPEAEDQQDAEQVWTNEYAAVYHLNDNPEETTRDATANNIDATSNGGMNKNDSLKAGKIGQAVEFDGSNDYLATQVGPLASGQHIYSVSAWVKADVLSGSIIADRYSSNFSYKYLLALGSDSFSATINRYPPAATTIFTSTSAPQIDRWHYVTLVADSSNNTATLFVDGREENKVSNTVTVSLSNPASIGARTGPGNDLYFNGLIDQVSVSRAAHSSSWIKAEYQNQCDCEDFLTISTTVESQTPSSSLSGGVAATITLKADRPLSFSSLSSFTANAGGEAPTFQLSNDAGKSWLFYTKDGWKGANPHNSAHRSSAADITGHVATFPTGDGKLLWKAYIPSGTTLDQIQIGYTPQSPAADGTAGQAPGSVFPSTVQALNSLFTMAFDREPSIQDWTYWATRMMAETKPLDAWLGAMEHAALFTK